MADCVNPSALIIDLQDERQKRASLEAQSLNRSLFSHALALWHDSAKLWALQCALAGVVVPPGFLDLCARTRDAIERRYSLR